MTWAERSDPAAFVSQHGLPIARRVAEIVGLEPAAGFDERGRAAMLRVVSAMPDNVPPETRIAAGIYQLARTAIMRRKPVIDPESRWLADGFAYAITEQLLRDRLGDAAAGVVSQRGAGAFADMKRRVNLGYWMGNGYDIDLPFESEQRLRQARAAFALEEARRLTDAHGVEIIGIILDESAELSLLAAAAQVTGENIADRLGAYQSFDTAEQGLARYAAELNRARAAGHTEEAVIPAKRIMELRRRFAPKDYALIALLLHEANQTDAALAVLAQRVQIGRDDADRLPYLLLLVDYAMRWGRRNVAYEAAEATLIIDENAIPALAARMRRQRDAGKLIQAKVTAARILELSENQPSEHTPTARQMIDMVEASVGFPDR